MIRLYFGERPLLVMEGQEKWSHWRPGIVQCEMMKAWTKATLRGAWMWSWGWEEGSWGFFRGSS